MQNTEEIWRHLDARVAAFTALADRIWETPELNFQKTKSAAAHTKRLRKPPHRLGSSAPRNKAENT